MMNEIQKLTKEINTRVTLDFFNKYKNYCDTNGFNISKRLRLLMENDINNKKIN